MMNVSEVHIFYGAIVIAAVLVAEALYLVFASASDRRKLVNKRVKLLEGNVDREAILIQLRKDRGMTGSGELRLPFVGLGKLLVQSGLLMGLGRFWAMVVGVAIAIGAVVASMREAPLEGVVVSVVLVAILPHLILSYLRGRRRKQFGIQLPEAIDLIVRSLKAGHPVPVAFAVVAREMPDPIGSEFGLVSDEVTFGSDFISALHKMQDRVGQEDLPLFLTAISIQSSTGGNLREILDGLAEVIRQRIKMRRKVKAISAEGRISAAVLTAMPVLLFAAVNLTSPEFYGEVWHETATWYGIGGAVAWLIAGNAMMMKMINFKI